MARYTPTNKAYVYTHKRLDKNCIFYVGIGSSANQKRAYETKKRNNNWINVNNITEIEEEVNGLFGGSIRLLYICFLYYF